MNRARRLCPAGCLLLTLVLLPGCADSVRTYEVPVTRQRTLGAIVLTEGNAWFVKLMGKSDDVAEQKDNFERFVKSLRFPKDGKEPVTWKVPEGWEQEPGNEMRYATFRLPKRLEVTVFKLGPQQVLPNVNRWREQLKLGPISRRELDRTARQEKLEGGVEALLVDLESPRHAPLPDDSPKSARLFDFDLPTGWAEESDPGRFAAAAFSVKEGDKQARVTITVAGGSLEANINRWRGEVGLPEADEAKLRADARPATVSGLDGLMVELAGPKGRSTLGVICPAGNQNLFVKMMGDSELVAKQKPAFEAFVASLKFRGDNRDE